MAGAHDGFLVQGSTASDQEVRKGWIVTGSPRFDPCIVLCPKTVHVLSIACRASCHSVHLFGAYSVSDRLPPRTVRPIRATPESVPHAHVQGACEEEGGRRCAGTAWRRATTPGAASSPLTVARVFPSLAQPAPRQPSLELSRTDRCKGRRLGSWLPCLLTSRLRAHRGGYFLEVVLGHFPSLFQNRVTLGICEGTWSHHRMQLSWVLGVGHMSGG